jgi:hypothetical protein
MTTNQPKTLTINLPEFGWKWEIDCPLFFTATQEKVGLDLKPLFKPLFAKYFQIKIARLEAAQELGALTEQGKIDLENYKTGEQILTAC